MAKRFLVAVVMAALLALSAWLSFPPLSGYPLVGNESYSMPTDAGIFAIWDMHEAAGNASGTVMHDVFGNNNLTLTTGSNCTWTGVSLYVTNGTCGAQVPDATFNAAKTWIFVISAQLGSSYRSLFSSPSENALYIDQDGYDLFTKNMGTSTNTSRTFSLVNFGNVNPALGTTQMITWIRDSSADTLYVGPTPVSSYSSRGGSLGFTAAGSGITIGSNPNNNNLSFNNHYLTIIAATQAMTQIQVARVFRGQQSLQNNKYWRTGGAGILDGRQTVADVGASIPAGSTLPNGPGGGVQANGWDVATLITPGNTTASTAGYTNYNLANATRTLNGAIQGATGPTLEACALENANCNSSGGDAVLGAMWNYRIESPSTLIDITEVSNGIPSYTVAQLIATHKQFIGLVAPFYRIISMTNPVIASTSSGANNTYLLTYNADVMANSVFYGSTLAFDLYNYPHAQDLSTTYRWSDQTHMNQKGQTDILAQALVAALRQIYVF